MPVHYSESVNQSSLICRYTFTKCCRLQLDDASIAGTILGFQSSSSSIDVAQRVIASLAVASNRLSSIPKSHNNMLIIFYFFCDFTVTEMFDMKYFEISFVNFEIHLQYSFLR